MSDSEDPTVPSLEPAAALSTSAAADSTTLAEALAHRQIALPAEQVALLDRYCRALWDWNAKLNLTRHTSYDRFAGRDVVDSLIVAKQLAQGERILDVGTGGGVPGVVLAIVRPDLRVTLSDSVAKKARAVEAIVREVGLPTRVVHEAAQTHLTHDRYDTLVVRAVARLSKLLTWLNPQRARFGRMLLIKGPAWVEERAEARHQGLMHGWELRRLASWPLEGTESESVLLELRSANQPSSSEPRD